jgi:transglutaminase-like putative cysteine protease
LHLLLKTGDLLVDPPVPLTAYRDGFGNWCTRLVAPSGRIRISSDALINDTGLTDPVAFDAQQQAVQDLPAETLVFLLGSRYCETDRLSETAWNLFGSTPAGWERVQAICDYVHHHVAFDYQNASPTRSALETLNGQIGVCRDYTHLAVALCRCLV